MFIKNYEIYKYCSIGSSYFTYDVLKVDFQGNLYYLRTFLFNYFGFKHKRTASDFISVLQSVDCNGIGVKDVHATFDHQNSLIYFSEVEDSFSKKPITSEIEDLLQQQNFLELCKIGFFNHVIITKQNFIYLMLVWDKIMEDHPAFIFLYQDDQEWFEVVPFDTQEDMQIFLNNHA